MDKDKRPQSRHRLVDPPHAPVSVSQDACLRCAPVRQSGCAGWWCPLEGHPVQPVPCEPSAAAAGQQALLRTPHLQLMLACDMLPAPGLLWLPHVCQTWQVYSCRVPAGAHGAHRAPSGHARRLARCAHGAPGRSPTRRCPARVQGKPSTPCLLCIGCLHASMHS